VEKYNKRGVKYMRYVRYYDENRDRYIGGVEMKPFLGINLTGNKKNEELNGEEFIVFKPSSIMQDVFDSSLEKADEAIEEAKLPKLLRIVQFITGALGITIVCGLIRALGEEESVSLSKAYQNAPWIFWAGGVSLVIWGILKIASGIKEKAVLGTEDNKYVFDKVEKTTEAIFEEMEVPSDARDVDVLCFYYKEKNGQIKITSRGMQAAPYMNPVFKVYRDAENLYLANLDGKYAFPFSSIVSVHTIKKRIRILGWNKETPYNKGDYKQFKLTTDNYGCVHCKQYHIIEVQHNGETWGVYVPNYEWPVFEKLMQ
jgi:hypothetical protein